MYSSNMKFYFKEQHNDIVLKSVLYNVKFDFQTDK